MTDGEVATEWPPRAPVPPRDAAEASAPRFSLVGVRCPRCHLGGDIPDSIERTVCPRCETVFTVATAQVVRPHDPAAAPPPPQRSATFDIERRISAERRTIPERRVVPERRNGVPPRPPGAATPPPTPRTSGRPGEIPITLPPAARPPQWPKLLIGGLAAFTAGLIVGWALTRDTAEGAEQVRSPAIAADAAMWPSTSLRVAGPSAASAGTGHVAASPGADTGDSRAVDSGTAVSPTVAPSGAIAPSPIPEPAVASPTTVSTADASPRAGQAPGSDTPRACTGLDCRMTVASPIEGIPVPDDSTSLTTPDGFYGWTTEAAGVEALTSWYRTYLAAHGWRLATEYSVMDPQVGQQRNLGYATSAIYCRHDGQGAVAVNIGLPLNDGTGLTVVMAIAEAPQPLKC